MRSLNELVGTSLAVYETRMKKRGVEINLILDINIPSIYSASECIRIREDKYSANTRKMLNELMGEHADLFVVRKPFTRLRIETQLVDNMQMLSISHNGEAIPEDTLKELNKKLASTSEVIRDPGVYERSGNKRAAVLISGYGGQISINNLPEGEYNIDTIVTLPAWNPSQTE